MKIAISGGKGFVGSRLVTFLQEQLHAEIVLIPRKNLYGPCSDLAKLIEGCSVVIHLSGASVLSRWTNKRKKILYDSRILTTRNLVDTFKEMDMPPSLFISTSAVGIYNEKGAHDEMSEDLADDFLGDLCVDWEKEAVRARKVGIRTAICRLGVVLSADGGALKRMFPAFKLGLGGRLGDGKQMFPFIHIYDLLQAYLYIIKNESCNGVYNLVSPQACNNNQFTIALAEKLNVPAFLPVPSFILKIMFGQGSNILLKGQKVFPKALQSSGFKFNYPDLDTTLNQLLRIKL